MDINKKIVLITTGQPATNPRLVKEADALYSQGYETVVLYSFWAEWAIPIDQKRPKTWRAVLCGGSPAEKPLLYWATRIRRKIAFYLKNYEFFRRRALARAYDELFNAAVREKGDLYIAHNAGALPVAAKVAQKVNSQFAFDAEDFHVGETHEANPVAIIIKKFESFYLPKASYISASSDLIAEAYIRRYAISKPIKVIRNVFPKIMQSPFVKLHDVQSLKLFWFSQTVGRNRGIQDVLHALKYLKDVEVSIGILGRVNVEDKIYFESTLVSKLHRIQWYEPRSERELVQLCSHFHIGIASEPGFSLSNNWALTNKLFTYLLAGNALLVSETEAQKQFMDQYPQVGYAYPIGDHFAIGSILQHCHENRAKLEQTRWASWTLSQGELNWENEQQKFIASIKSVL